MKSAQKAMVMKFIDKQRAGGRSVGEVLTTLGIGRATYYRWKQKQGGDQSWPRTTYPLTPDEKRLVEQVKATYPHLRHRQLQGVLQTQGVYLSATAIYHHLKGLGQVEPYARRPSPWTSPRYEVWRRNLIWGCDWTRLKVGSLRWYLLTVMDFFSRLIIAFELVPMVNASHVKAVYRTGLRAQRISLASASKPRLRVDQGSPNTARVTQEFFESLGANLSFARVRRPTDNAITERFYGTIKQEEIYLVGNYPDERSAREELGQYITYYNHKRPHQAVMNFTPAYVHEVNNKTLLVEERNELKRKARETRKQYWLTRKKETH